MSFLHYIPCVLEFHDDCNRNNANSVALSAALLTWPPLGQVTTHVMPKDSASPPPMDYWVVLFIKCFDRLVYQELSNGKAFEAWMLVSCYYIKSTSENQTAWLQRGLAGVN